MTGLPRRIWAFTQSRLYLAILIGVTVGLLMSYNVPSIVLYRLFCLLLPGL